MIDAPPPKVFETCFQKRNYETVCGTQTVE